MNQGFMYTHVEHTGARAVEPPRLVVSMEYNARTNPLAEQISIHPGS